MLKPTKLVQKSSFIAPNILPLKTLQKASKPLSWLHKGHNDRVFFFNRAEKFGMTEYAGYDSQFPNIYI